jgi:hypothetical protein
VSAPAGVATVAVSRARLAREIAAGALEGARRRRWFDALEAFVCFLGYPRSGHTLVGSLLDAHPEVLVAHELDVLRFVRPWIPRTALLGLLARSEARFARRGFEWQGYDYRVPGQWQGRVSRLRVAGDKRGRATTERLHHDPALLDRLRRKLGVPVRFVHVVRNPYDNITTMARRAHGDLALAARRYFELCDGVAAVRARLAPGEILDVRHEDVVADPRGALARLCAFVGVEPDDAYLEACASVVFPSPRRSRHDGPWTPALVSEVAERAAAYPFLAGYTFEEG